MKMSELIDENANRIDILEGKLDIILWLAGGQFLGFLGLIITLLNMFK